MKNLDGPESNVCVKQKIPLWLVLLDNVPTLILFITGFLITNYISTTGAIAYGLYAMFSIIWFWGMICPYCHHYGTLACPCGYGVVSSKFFSRGNDKSFKTVFRRNILIQFPNWFIPLGIAIYLVLTRNNTEITTLTIIFVLTGFLIIPLVSKLVGCRNCEVKDECPWMENKRNK